MTTEGKGAAAPRPSVIIERTAKEARRLALECFAGRGPTLIAGDFRNDSGDSCALGWVLRRSGGRNVDPWERFRVLADELRRIVHDPEIQLRQHDAWHLVIQANNNTGIQYRAAAVVFPLLALADVLDEARGTATEGSP